MTDNYKHKDQHLGEENIFKRERHYISDMNIYNYFFRILIGEFAES